MLLQIIKKMSKILMSKIKFKNNETFHLVIFWEGNLNTNRIIKFNWILC